MSERFDVLNRHFSLDRSMVVEASAGTGKTFSIENLFVRMLLEGDGIPVENILVVTFTKAATAELRERVYETIHQAIKSLKEGDCKGKDYLQAFIEKGEIAVQGAIRRLNMALFFFDDAQIYTIHGFCASLLTEFSFDSTSGFSGNTADDLASSSLAQKVVRNFFHTGIRDKRYTTKQLEIVLKKHSYKLNSLERELIKFISGSTPIKEQPSVLSLFNSFSKVWTALRSSYDPELLYADFINQAPHYKGLCNRSKEIK